MPSAKSDERLKAEQIFRDSGGSIKLVEIAEQLGVSASKVRKWKSLDGWDKKSASSGKAKKKQVERSTSSKGSVPLSNVPPKPKKRGAPKDNKNAVGNSGGIGGPVGNKNSEKHGIYAGVFWDTLDDEERQMIDNLPDDEVQHLFDEVKLLTVRERRIMQIIQEIGKAPLLVEEVYRTEEKREFANKEDRELYEERQREKVVKNELLPGHSYRVGTSTRTAKDLLLRAHAELTRVQSQKARVLAQINQMGVTKDRLAFEERRLNLELMKVEIAQQLHLSDTDSANSNFLEAMMGVAKDVWEDGEPDNNTAPEDE